MDCRIPTCDGRAEFRITAFAGFWTKQYDMAGLYCESCSDEIIQRLTSRVARPGAAVL